MLNCKLVSLLLAVTLLTAPARSAISVSYDNGTGAYSISGSDAGPGVVDGTLRYLWNWGLDLLAANVVFVLAPMHADENITGTVDGNGPYTLPPIGFLGETRSGLECYTITDTGTLALVASSGTISTGLWNFGVGTFTGTPYGGTTTESMSFTVTHTVPEPSTWAALGGLFALGLAVWRRRVTKLKVTKYFGAVKSTFLSAFANFITLLL